MSDVLPKRVWGLAAALLAVAAAAAGAFGGVQAAAGVLAGGLWNLTSLWCLIHLLHAWLGPTPSRRRAVGWLLVKFPLLYLLVFLLLGRAGLSIVGFGVGFSLVLLVVVGGLAGRVMRLGVMRPHGR